MDNSSQIAPRPRPRPRAGCGIRTSAVIAGKDLTRQLRSGIVLLFGLALPLGLAFLFSTIMPSGDEGLQISYAAVDDDGGPAAAVFVDDVLAAVAAEGTVELRRVDTVQQATSLVEQGEVAAAFVVPSGFSTDIEAGRTAELRVIGSAASAVGSHLARVIAEAYATEVRGAQLAVAVTAAGGAVDNPEQLAQRAQAAPRPLVLHTDDSAAHRELDLSTYYAAGMAVFFLFFVAMLSVSGIIEERADKTMARLLAAPASRPAILAGKLLGGVGIAALAMTVLVAASTLLFDASWGPALGVAVLVAAVVLAATGLMALVATLARTTEQATNWMSVLAVLLGLFGGSFVPLAQLGDLAAVAYVTPHRWFLQGLSDLAGGDLSAVVVPAGVLLAMAGAALILTTLRIGKVIAP